MPLSSRRGVSGCAAPRQRTDAPTSCAGTQLTRCPDDAAALNPSHHASAPTPTELIVRDLGHRWGSCTYGTGRIRMHWATILLPASIIDYVIVHELVHLAVRTTRPRSGARSSGCCRTTGNAGAGWRSTVPASIALVSIIALQASAQWRRPSVGNRLRGAAYGLVLGRRQNTQSGTAFQISPTEAGIFWLSRGPYAAGQQQPRPSALSSSSAAGRRSAPDSATGAACLPVPA